MMNNINYTLYQGYGYNPSPIERINKNQKPPTNQLMTGVRNWGVIDNYTNIYDRPHDTELLQLYRLTGGEPLYFFQPKPSEIKRGMEELKASADSYERSLYYQQSINEPPKLLSTPNDVINTENANVELSLDDTRYAQYNKFTNDQIEDIENNLNIALESDDATSRELAIRNIERDLGITSPSTSRIKDFKRDISTYKRLKTTTKEVNDYLKEVNSLKGLNNKQKKRLIEQGINQLLKGNFKEVMDYEKYGNDKFKDNGDGALIASVDKLNTNFNALLERIGVQQQSSGVQLNDENQAPSLSGASSTSLEQPERKEYAEVLFNENQVNEINRLMNDLYDEFKNNPGVGVKSTTKGDMRNKIFGDNFSIAGNVKNKPFEKKAREIGNLIKDITGSKSAKDALKAAFKIYK